MTHYIRTNPLLVAVSASKLSGHERLYGDRITLKNPPQIGELVSAEVIRLPAGKVKYKIVFRNRELRCYLPEAFERIERGGKQLGNNRCWITTIWDSKHETTNDDIPRMPQP